MKKRIGTVGVDAGMVWIGDPCYVLHREAGEQPKDIGANWEEFCNRVSERQGASQSWAQFQFDMGHDGLGIAVESGYGDGEYPVFADIAEDGRIRSVTVRFIEGGK